MPRAKRVLSDQFPYNITARSINKDWFKLPISVVWTIFCDHLYFCNHAYGAKIHAFVLMNNHFHMILSTPEANISEVMHYFMSITSKEITKQSGRINQTYGGPYYASLITTDIYYQHAYKYLYRNPVEAGLSPTAESYYFSSLHSLLGQSKCFIPLSPDELLFANVERTLAWINTPYEPTIKDQLQKSLKKQIFKFAATANSRKQNSLEIIS